MNLSISRIRKNPLMKGTLFLTISGILCKSIGFFYRIFLSRTIGAEGLGLQQLILPVFMVLLAICSSGIMTATSRCVSFDAAHGPVYFRIGFLSSMILSLLCGAGIFIFSVPLSSLIGDSRTIPLLRYLAIAILPCSLHNCIYGYCFGRKNSILPSVSLFMEQFLRLAFMIAMYYYCQFHQLQFHYTYIGAGLLVGECAGFICSFHVYYQTKCPRLRRISQEQYSSFFHLMLPISINQLLVGLFRAAEMALIPLMLIHYGYSSSDALSILGVFTGMAMSIILCPAVMINALCNMLLPEIAEARNHCDHARLYRLTQRALWFGMGLGILCALLFFLSRNYIANTVFKNALVANYIGRLSFLCPLLYIEYLLQSILNAECYSTYILFINLATSVMRILVIILFIPLYGMEVYILGLILSAGINIILQFLVLRLKKEDKKRPST